MKAFRPLILLATITTLLLTACTPSIFPLITEEQTVFDDALLGSWKSGDDGSESWTFTKSYNRGSEKDYSLSITNGSRSSQFACQLGKLDGNLYLQLILDENDPATKTLEDLGELSLIRGYVFFRVWQIEPELRMSIPDPERLKELLESDPKAPAHGQFDCGRRIVLTAQTRELQQFIIRHAADGQLFKRPVSKDSKLVYKRLADPAAKKP